MNTKELTFMLIAAIMGLFVSSCSEDDEEEVHLSVEIKADGTTSNGSIFSTFLCYLQKCILTAISRMSTLFATA